MSAFIGQFHPLLVHLPIGFLVLALLFFLLKKWGKIELDPRVLTWMVLASFAAAAFSSITGFLLANDGGYNADLVNKHRLAGLALTFVTLVLYFLLRRNPNEALINGFWGLSALLVTLTGHWGGSLTHGEEYFSFGKIDYIKPEITDPQQALVYKEIIEPIFAEKCWSCHSAKKQKGDLRLDAPEYILKGGENGAILVAHQAAKSDLYKRLLLEKDDDDHMPPDGKPQLNKNETALVEWWINQGLPFEKKAGELEQSPSVKMALNSLVISQETPPPLPEATVSEAGEELIHEIREKGFAVAPVAAGSPFLSVSLIGKKLDDEDWKLLQSIEKNLVWLRAPDLAVSPAIASVISSLDNLTVLDLNQSVFEEQAHMDFTGLKKLQRLNLSQSNISLQDLQSLSGLPHLKQLYLFKTPVSYEEARKIAPQAEIEANLYEVPTLEGDTSEFKRSELEGK